MTTENTEKTEGKEETATQPPQAAKFRVQEAPRQFGGSQRLFSVTCSQVPGDLGVVAAAKDDATGLAIPAAGSAHPDYPEMVARPPTIYSVGSRDAGGGAMLAARGRFFNVAVTYTKTEK